MPLIRRVVVPVDFSPSSQQAVDYAVDLARQYGAELHLLHVLLDLDAIAAEPGVAFAPVDEWMPQLVKLAEKKLADLKASVSSGLTTVTAVRDGSPGSEVVRYATDVKADLIVMSTHGRTGLKHILLGSVAENVIRHAACPVLVVRQPAG